VPRADPRTRDPVPRSARRGSPPPDRAQSRRAPPPAARCGGSRGFEPQPLGLPRRGPDWPRSPRAPRFAGRRGRAPQAERFAPRGLGLQLRLRRSLRSRKARCARRRSQGVRSLRSSAVPGQASSAASAKRPGTRKPIASAAGPRRCDRIRHGSGRSWTPTACRPARGRCRCRRCAGTSRRRLRSWQWRARYPFSPRRRDAPRRVPCARPAPGPAPAYTATSQSSALPRTRTQPGRRPG